MTNPNNAVGTNAAYSGRTSPDAFNDIVTWCRRGILVGWHCSPKSGMTVQLGGDGSHRDVAVASDNAGNKRTINNRSGAPIDVTLAGAPSTNSRIDAIIAYVDNPTTGDGSTTDNPTACGLIAVSGAVAANPTAPDDATIRAAITTDGGTGGTAFYTVLATILVGTNVTTIGSGVITQGRNTPGIIDNLFYQKGDTFKTKHSVCYPGVLSNSASRIHLSIPVDKRLDNITTVTCTSFVGGIRPVTGGYLGSNAEEFVGDVYECKKESETSVYLAINVGTHAWTGTAPVNNTPLVAQCVPAFSFS